MYPEGRGQGDIWSVACVKIGCMQVILKHIAHM